MNKQRRGRMEMIIRIRNPNSVDEPPEDTVEFYSNVVFLDRMSLDNIRDDAAFNHALMVLKDHLVRSVN